MKEFGKILLMILFSAGGSIGWILGGEQGIYVALGFAALVVLIAFLMDLSNDRNKEKERR